MDDKDWGLIDSLLQDLALVESGLISEQYKNSFEKKMSQEVLDQAIKSKLIELMRKM